MIALRERVGVLSLIKGRFDTSVLRKGIADSDAAVVLTICKLFGQDLLAICSECARDDQCILVAEFETAVNTNRLSDHWGINELSLHCTQRQKSLLSLIIR